MARTLFFPKDELRRRLRAFRLDEVKVAEITSVFDKNNRHIDVISFVIMLERYGVQRAEISSFLHDIGVDESTLQACHAGYVEIQLFRNSSSCRPSARVYGFNTSLGSCQNVGGYWGIMTCGG